MNGIIPMGYFIAQENRQPNQEWCQRFSVRRGNHFSMGSKPVQGVFTQRCYAVTQLHRCIRYFQIVADSCGVKFILYNIL